MLHAVIMAGGSGTRFWPRSRERHPKQFLPLVGTDSMLRQTLDRVADWIPSEHSWIVTNRIHAEETARQLPELPAANILQEPCGRNTAPCIGLAALQILARDPNGVMLVMPADHLIRPPEIFRKTVQTAIEFVSHEPDALVLFGIPPRTPSVSFGYIERGQQITNDLDKMYRVASFREKPDAATAQAFLSEGRFYWNSGIFLWRADTIVAALEQFEPSIGERLKRLQCAISTPDWEATLADEFPAMKSISIDYAVLEHAENVCVLEAPFEWDDVGSWQALARLRGSDAQGNTHVGPVRTIESQGCIVWTTPDHVVGTIGLSDCIVVHTPDATLIARKDDEEGIRKLIQLLRETGDERFL